MSLAANSFQVNSFLIETLDQNTIVDLAGSSAVVLLDYFESLMSPNIIVKVVLSSTTSLTNTLPIRGGERVSINITTAYGNLVFEDERSLYVHSVKGINPDSVSETFMMELTSREAIVNETRRCLSRYDGNIDATVKKILREVLSTEKFKEVNIEPTANSYSFVGNTKKPFSVLYWLCSKSLPIANSSKTVEVDKRGLAKGVGGFLFYENSEGFNFKSVESLVSRTNQGTSNLKNIPLYGYSQVIETNKISNERRIINYSIEKNSDLINCLSVGMYSNFTYSYNLYNNKLSVYQYNLADEIENASKLGTNDGIPIIEEFRRAPTRILFRTSDIGVMDNNLDGTRFDESQQRDIADIAKSTARYNLLYTQSLNMSVPCNSQLKVGDVIYAEFPKLGRGDTGEVNREQSGLYLIAELRHHIQSGNVTTHLKLIRDSYGLYGTENLT